VLVGRVDESGALDRVLAGARNEVGGALFKTRLSQLISIASLGKFPDAVLLKELECHFGLPGQMHAVTTPHVGREGYIARPLIPKNRPGHVRICRAGRRWRVTAVSGANCPPIFSASRSGARTGDDDGLHDGHPLVEFS
jgi:hypothetical protein